MQVASNSDNAIAVTESIRIIRGLLGTQQAFMVAPTGIESDRARQPEATADDENERKLKRYPPDV